MRTTLALLLVLAVASSRGLGQATPSGPVASKTGDLDGWEVLNVPLKEFVVKDVEGHELNSESLEGGVLIIDFWASWCGPCIKELPDLITYHETIKKREDVFILSFNVTDPRAALDAFLKAHSVPFPVYPADDLMGPFRVTSFPTKIIVDLRSVRSIRFRRQGFTPVSSIEARVRDLLEDKNPSALPTPVPPIKREVERYWPASP